MGTTKVYLFGLALFISLLFVSVLVGLVVTTIIEAFSSDRPPIFKLLGILYFVAIVVWCWALYSVVAYVA